MAKLNSYKELIVWQKAVKLIADIYQVCTELPGQERFGLESQTKRAAVSVPSNIAEGWGRQSRKSYVQFLKIARGSLCEVETQLYIAKELRLLSEIKHLEEQISEISRMLNSMISKLESKDARVNP